MRNGMSYEAQRPFHNGRSKKMEIVVNGKNFTCSDSLTIEGLLVELGLMPDTILVERNAAILQRCAYTTTVVSEGDSLEFISFVGGG